jgi:hypothetical protein
MSASSATLICIRVEIVSFMIGRPTTNVESLRLKWFWKKKEPTFAIFLEPPLQGKLQQRIGKKTFWPKPKPCLKRKLE